MTRHLVGNPQFYLTAPKPCPYLEDRQERKIFTYLVGEEAPALNDALSQGGFRRSQTIAYRPACEACSACLSVRVLVGQFHYSKSQRRVLKRNKDIIRIEKPARATTEQYALFQSYLQSRHGDGGMSDMTITDYAEMIEESNIDTGVIEYRMRDADSGLTGTSKGPLIGVALTDRLGDGTSMVYSFFDPDMADRSLGTFIILDHIRAAIAEGIDHVYLGYWIKNSPKMAYKGRFLPMEFLGPQGWELLE